MAPRRRSTSTDLVYDKILQKIMSEHLQPGTPLREERIAEEFGVSATPVREAFRRLEYEGWLQRFPYCGCVLHKYSRDELREVYALRQMLEGLAAAAAARRATAREIEAIRRAVDNERAYIDAETSGGKTEFSPSFESDIDFHRAVASASGNKLLIQRLSTLNAQISVTFLVACALMSSSEELERVHTEHKMILGAIERRWSDAAEFLMRRHIGDASPRMLIAEAPPESVNRRTEKHCAPAGHEK